MNVIQEGTICLIKSAITGAAVVLPEQFSLDRSYEMAAKQGFIPLLYEGAIRCGVPKDGALMQKMRLQTYKHMLISEQQMREVARLLETFDQQGIDHMPVKGCNMKALYPKPELRSMGDADILIRREQLPRCGEIMRSLGYKLSQESDHTDNWQSEKLYVELKGKNCSKTYSYFKGSEKAGD